jgi:hypothetical protein
MLTPGLFKELAQFGHKWVQLCPKMQKYRVLKHSIFSIKLN